MKMVAVTGLIAIAAALPMQAVAQADSTYLGVGAGKSRLKGGCDAVGGAGVVCDDSDTAFRFFGGYQFTRHVAAEVAYANLGSVRASSGAGSASSKASALELSGIGLLPLGDFAVLGRFGGFQGETRNNGLVSGTKTVISLTYGLGVQYHFTPRLGIRGEWQRFRSFKARNDATGAETDFNADMATLNLLWRFE
jgi:OmpA-OmpF porin, OOP family